MSTPASPNHKKDLVVVENLVKYFPVRGGILQRVQAWVQAVDDVSFTIREGETLGLVGEFRLRQDHRGAHHTQTDRAHGRPRDLLRGSLYDLPPGKLKDMRRNMQIIFQDPYSSLDPRMTIGESVAEGLRIHGIGSAQERHEQVLDILHKVGLEDYHAQALPPRILRRTAPAHRHRPGPGAQSQVHRGATSRSPRWMCPSRPRC